MRVVLNESTNTVHKPSREASPQPTDCGALRHVSENRFRVISGDELESRERIERCGRCFEDSGGY